MTVNTILNRFQIHYIHRSHKFVRYMLLQNWSTKGWRPLFSTIIGFRTAARNSNSSLTDADVVQFVDSTLSLSNSILYITHKLSLTKKYYRQIYIQQLAKIKPRPFTFVSKHFPTNEMHLISSHKFNSVFANIARSIS